MAYRGGVAAGDDGVGKDSGMSWRAILIRSDWRCCSLVHLAVEYDFVAERTDETMQKANQILLRVTTMTLGRAHVRHNGESA